jgi:hypothetical protein
MRSSAAFGTNSRFLNPNSRELAVFSGVVGLGSADAELNPGLLDVVGKSVSGTLPPHRRTHPYGALYYVGWPIHLLSCLMIDNDRMFLYIRTRDGKGVDK